MEWLTESSIIAPLEREYHENVGFCFTGRSMNFELDGAVSPIVRIHGSGNQELEMAFLTIISNNLLGSENDFSHYYT